MIRVSRLRRVGSGMPGCAARALWAAHTRRGLDAALAQIPRSSQTKILVRVDGAGATHGRVERGSQGSGVQDRGDHAESPKRSQGFTPHWRA
ncbi:hypothetical protein SAMN05444521_3245 [Streptomyces sp. 3214.6]|nr:hypothetical protein SAMN05444521_3245 [Streptomyces sp. 3214.6]